MKELIDSLKEVEKSIIEGKTSSLMIVTNGKFILFGDASEIVETLSKSVDKSDVVKNILENALGIEEVEESTPNDAPNKYVPLDALLYMFKDDNIEDMYKVLSDEMAKGIEEFELVSNKGTNTVDDPKSERKAAYAIVKLMFGFLPKPLVKITGNKERDEELRKVIVGLIWAYGNMKFAFRVDHRDEIQEQATKINDDIFDFINKYMDKKEASKSIIESLVAIIKKES